MSEIVFRTCAVAFLDILGFQNFIRRVEEPASEALNEFSRLQEVIRRQLIFTTSDTQQQHLFPSDLGLECIHISDSFILSAPISSDAHPGYSGLVAVSIKAIQLSHQLLGMGFLLRGGISVGNVYRTPKNIFGTGYQDAYNTEAYCAATPRILFHQSAAKALENDHHSGVKTTNLSIIMKEDHQFILDSLNTHWSYVGDDPDFNVLDVYNGYRATIIKNIADATDTKVRAKWEWAAGLFNLEIVVGGDGEARFDHIDAKLGQGFSHAQFLRQSHGEAGGLLAIAQGGVEDDDAIVGDFAEIGMIYGHGFGL